MSAWNQTSQSSPTGARPITVAVDAMGGDYAPGSVVRGAVLAARESDLDIVLVGRGSEIRGLLPAPQRNLRIAEASEAVAMDAQPTQVRQLRDSSIMVGLGLIAEGEADAFLSFGNTGAVMAASLFRLGRIPGVARPALGALFRNGRGTTSLILDVGANVEARPHYLGQFATMGKAYVERVLRHRNPSVGLLNVGEESSKGTPLQQEAYELLRRQEPNFVGNIEGTALIAGQADVIVADGFTGNVVVKLSEGLLELLMGELKKSVRAKLTYMVGGEADAGGVRFAARPVGLCQGRVGAAVRDRRRGAGRTRAGQSGSGGVGHSIGARRGRGGRGGGDPRSGGGDGGERDGRGGRRSSGRP